MKKSLILGLLMGMGLLGVMAVDLTENPLVEVGHFQDVVTKSTPVVDVRAFGAVGDGVTDDTDAIQAAIDAAEAAGGVVFLPPGTYLVSADLTIASNGFCMDGSGIGKSIIRASAGVTKVLSFAVGVSARVFLSDFDIDADSVADYGLYMPAVAFSRFMDVRVYGANVAGIYSNEGWGNRYVRCISRLNNGDGIYLATQANAVVLDGCTLTNNTGRGVVVYESRGVEIRGCWFEDNSQASIHMLGDIKGLTVTGCYFEANAETGYTFTTPSTNVQADIILNGGTSGSPAVASISYPIEGVEITGNFMNPTTAYNQDSWIYAPGLSGAHIAGNVLHVDKSMTLMTAPWHQSYTLAKNITLTANENWTKIFDANTPTGIVRWNSSSDFYSSQAYQLDLAERDLGKWTLSGEDPNWTYTGHEVINSQSVSVYSMTTLSATSTGAMQFSLDSADYPDLSGKICCFSVYVKGDTDKAANVYVSSAYATSAYESSAAWTRKIYAFAWPASGTILFGARKIGAAGTVYVAAPMLYELGANWNALYTKHRAGHVHATGISVSNGDTSAGYVDFYEDSDNGTNRARLIGPASTADVEITLPAATGTVALQSTVSGTLILDDGATERITLVFTNGVLTSRTVAASSGAAIDWTDP